MTFFDAHTSLEKIYTYLKDEIASEKSFGYLVTSDDSGDLRVKRNQ